MNRDSLLEDLDYVRTLAEEGRSAPLIGGRFLVFWGLWFTLVLLAHWAIVTGRAPVGPQMLWVLWIGQGVLGGAIHALLLRGVERKPGAGAVNNRVAEAVWLGLMSAMVALWIGVAAGVLIGDAPVILFNMMPASALMLYGVAHLVTARFSGGDGRFAALGAFVFAAAGFASVAHVETYLIAAAGVFCVGVVPGVVQLMREPKLSV